MKPAQRFKRGTPFWDRVDRSGDGCWEWLGSRQDHGYARVWFNGAKVYVHRRAFELAVGPIPPGLVVCHHCDNPSCCRPDHLFLGTQADNVADMVAKGRLAVRHGERNPRAKFSDALIARARRLSASGLAPHEVSERTGISATYVGRLALGHGRVNENAPATAATGTGAQPQEEWS